MSKRRELKVGDWVKITGHCFGHCFDIGDVGEVILPVNAQGNVDVRVGTLRQGLDRGCIAYDRKTNADKAKYEARRG